MRRAITSCVLAGTLVVGAGPAFGDEPASGLSRWFRNPFAKSAPTTAEPESTENAGANAPTAVRPARPASATGRSATRPATVPSAEGRREPAKPAQPVSAPKRLQAPPVRSADEAPSENNATLTPSASTRRAPSGSNSEAEPPRTAGLMRRKPSARAVRGSLLDDEPVAASASAEAVDQTPVRAETPAEAPAAPPRRRFMPLGRGPQPSRPATPETAVEAFEPAVDPRLPAPPPDDAIAGELGGIDRVPDPARTSPDDAAPVIEPMPNIEEVAEEVADEEPMPPSTSVPLVEAEDAPSRPADKSTRPSLLPWRPSFFSKPAAPKPETTPTEPTPVADEETPRTPARSSKPGRRPMPTRPNAAQPELQLESGDLEEVQVIGDEPQTAPEPPRAPKATPRPRTVEAESPSERPTTAAAERPSLSQRFKGWWGVKK